MERSKVEDRTECVGRQECIERWTVKSDGREKNVRVE
jgi:hypothetical protein